VLLGLLLLFPVPVAAQGLDLDDEPEPTGARTRGPEPADEPGISQTRGEPGGRLAMYLRPPPGTVRSPAIALILPLTLTLVPVVTGVGLFAADSEQVRTVGFVVMNTGLLLGPSVGHFYAGEPGHGLLTLGIRGALVAGSLALYAAAQSTTPDRPNHSYDEDTAGLLGVLAFTLAIGAFGVGICDFIDAPRAANRTNARVLISSVAVAPMIIRRDRESQLGLMIAARF